MSVIYHTNITGYKDLGTGGIWQGKVNGWVMSQNVSILFSPLLQKR